MMDMGGGMGGPMGGAVGGGTPATDPVELIAQAVQLHAAHMDGSMPPTPESQAALMTLLQEALMRAESYSWGEA